MRKTYTQLLVMIVTTTAIIAAATTASLSSATPAFAKVNCNETETVCSGGSSIENAGGDPRFNGGFGGRTVEAGTEVVSGGGGFNFKEGGAVGGHGSRTICDGADCTHVGGSGPPN